MDPVFRALADPTRRGLLDELFREDGQTLSALEQRVDMTRFGVMKHLKILAEAGLITTRRQGRAKLHYLNPVPIRLIHDRWVGKYARPWTSMVNPATPGLEESAVRKVFEIYIKATPERLWEAMTDSEMRAAYNFGVGVTSDWSLGSSYRSAHPLSPDPLVEGENLEVEPPRRLVQTFRARWDEAVRAAGTSRVTWDVEQAGDTCRLTLTHDDLPTDASPELYGSWPVILSSLKTFLETGQELIPPGSSSGWGTLGSKLAELRGTQADDLVTAAARAAGSAQAIALLRQAVDRDPGHVQARYQLGVALGRAADYTAAITELRAVVESEEDFAEGWRDLGVVLSRAGQLTAAEEAFCRSLELDDSQAETWANLGGLRRRMARAAAGAAFDWDMLREARAAYHHASELLGHKTYSLVNEARVDLLLSAKEPGARPAILARLRQLEHLARYEAYPEAPQRRDPWNGFDLADTLLLTGRTDDGLAELRSAIELVDRVDRVSTLTSVIGPLRDFLVAAVLDESAADGVRAAVAVCEQAIEAARPAPVGLSDSPVRLEQKASHHAHRSLRPPRDRVPDLRLQPLPGRRRGRHQRGRLRGPRRDRPQPARSRDRPGLDRRTGQRQALRCRPAAAGQLRQDGTPARATGAAGGPAAARPLPGRSPGLPRRPPDPLRGARAARAPYRQRRGAQRLPAGRQQPARRRLRPPDPPGGQRPRPAACRTGPPGS
jgi:uncharacterized protein YndB with AHSA1/START domain/DNA-binding transcriptional ArsR family regulator